MNLLSVFALATVLAPSPAAVSYVPGEVLVILAPSRALEISGARRITSTDAALGQALTRHGLGEGEALDVGGTPRYLRLRSARVDFDPVAAARDLVASGAVRAAVPNYRLRLHVLPNDTYLGYQWAIQDPGDADIDLPEAWDVETGSATTRIAVMDTGVDLGHPDLASKIWTNPAEIPGNSIDDDGNGRVDDVNGWDFGDDDADPNPGPVFDLATDIDVGFHGTFVAAIAAAASNNSEGIAGAAWNCKIIPLKVADAAGDLTMAAVTSAFAYATQLHVEVLNMSLGSPADPGVPAFFQALVDDAYAAGVFCVASAGNDGTNALNYPAACTHVLSVAATDDVDQRASFSNYGPTVDVAAPGATIWSAICRNYEIDEFSQIFYLYLWYWDGENPYMYGDGTSFAAPLVAGVAGLVLSRFPTLDPDQVTRQLVLFGDDVAYDQPIGKKVNAFRSVNTLVDVPTASSTPLRLELAGSNPVTTGTALEFALPERARVRLALIDCTGRRVRDLVSGEFEPGRHVVRWDGAGPAGERLPGGIYYAALEAGGSRAVRRLVVLR